ncbi:hypothetical protein RMATCC62417_11017 [Rhizopus microsporus]|nr:hypothetical protein RMATCC62417_11017 [Rhizopus microsporus]
MDKELYQSLIKKISEAKASHWDCVQKLSEKIMFSANIREMETNIEETKLVESDEKTCRFMKKIFTIMAYVFRKTPPLLHSEFVFNSNMILPCLMATISVMEYQYSSYFVRGEEDLTSMAIQLVKMGAKIDKRMIYKAGGVVRLTGLQNLEVMVLETADPYSRHDQTKTAFDNTKGMFALLAMLKTVADTFENAKVEQFKNSKLYLLQPSGKQLLLWSMQCVQNELYNFVRESNVTVS